MSVHERPNIHGVRSLITSSSNCNERACRECEVTQATIKRSSVVVYIKVWRKLMAILVPMAKLSCIVTVPATWMRCTLQLTWLFRIPSKRFCKSLSGRMGEFVSIQHMVAFSTPKPLQHPCWPSSRVSQEIYLFLGPTSYTPYTSFQSNAVTCGKGELQIEFLRNAIKC